MKKLIIMLILISLNFSCTHKKTACDFIELGKSQVHYNSVDEYLARKKLEIHSDNTLLLFVFLNNPYNLNDNNLVSIYINCHLVYIGEYKRHLELIGLPDSIFSRDKRMTISMEILTDKNKEIIWQHRFQSKSVFSWNKGYKVIYCGFYPTNEDVEKVYFIPQLEPMI